MSTTTTQETNTIKTERRNKAIKIAAIAGGGLMALAAGVYLKKRSYAKAVDLVSKTPMKELFDLTNDPAFTASKVTDAMGRVFEGYWFDPGNTSDEYIFFTTKDYLSE